MMFEVVKMWFRVHGSKVLTLMCSIKDGNVQGKVSKPKVGVGGVSTGVWSG